MLFRKKYDKPGTRFDFLDARCIEASCWAPGEYQHRGATSSGSRSTGSASRCCLSRAYRGCPRPDERGYDVALGRLRRAEGWKRA
jgi:hypothetical protein